MVTLNQLIFVVKNILNILTMNNLLLLILLLIFSYVFFNPTKYSHEKFWYQCPNNDRKRLLKKSLTNNGIKRTFDDSLWNIYVPCKNSEKELKNLIIKNNNQIVFMVSDSWLIGTKKFLWKVLQDKYGTVFSSSIMPKTYIMPEDRKIFLKEYGKKMYILKQEKQRQEGLYLSKNKNDILNKTKNGLFKVVQEYEPNCYLFNGRKINLRIYILLVCRKGAITTWVYRDGIISYTKNKYKPNSLSFDDSIASFYLSKSLYNAGWSITLKQFKIQYENQGHSWEILFDKIKRIIHFVSKAIHNRMCKRKSVFNNVTAELFGADFILDNNHNVKIIEINKGPGMTPYMNADKKMRTKLQSDILELVNLKKYSPMNDFELI